MTGNTLRHHADKKHSLMSQEKNSVTSVSMTSVELISAKHQQYSRRVSLFFCLQYLSSLLVLGQVMNPAKFSTNILYYSADQLSIVSGWSLSNQSKGNSSSAIGKNEALRSLSPPAISIAWEQIRSHCLGPIFLSHFVYIVGWLELWRGRRYELSQ